MQLYFSSRASAVLYNKFVSRVDSVLHVLVCRLRPESLDTVKP